jgi:hypothetical protein
LDRYAASAELRYGQPTAITVVTDATDMKSAGAEGQAPI